MPQRPRALWLVGPRERFTWAQLGYRSAVSVGICKWQRGIRKWQRGIRKWQRGIRAATLTNDSQTPDAEKS
eukprot:SAG31_NODE_17301_length_676_cov_0.984402_1_plen_70_part_01